MIRRLLARFGWAVVLTWTPRHKSWQVVRHRWHFAVSLWRTEK